jgi:hypothetical protein
MLSREKKRKRKKKANNALTVIFRSVLIGGTADSVAHVLQGAEKGLQTPRQARRKRLLHTSLQQFAGLWSRPFGLQGLFQHPVLAAA